MCRQDFVDYESKMIDEIDGKFRPTTASPPETHELQPISETTPALRASQENM